MHKLATLLVSVAFVAHAGAQVAVGPVKPQLVTFTSSTTPDSFVTAYAQLTGSPHSAYKLLVAPHQEQGFALGQSTQVLAGFLDAKGEATASWNIGGLQAMPIGYAVDVLAISGGGGAGKGKASVGKRVSNKTTLPLGQVKCEKLDFDYTIGLVEPKAGQWMTNNWSLIGLNISATNNVPTHPDKAIIFDSSNPTGDDWDLQTPGTGPGNTQALGKLLIVAENDIDANNDGFVDDPDDEAEGGWLSFEFDEGVSVCSATLVDIDDGSPTRIKITFADATPPAVIFVPNAGNNSVQKVSFSYSNVARLDVILGGSGGLAELEFAPCPGILLLDETMTGKPVPHRAGTWMSGQFKDTLGISFSALNNFVGHPDKAILFDSANPTGGDFDLATPGVGVGNVEALGTLLIIAENDIDANMDGIIDDPDDEAKGGVLRVDFENTVQFVGATVVDIDTYETAFFRLLDEANGVIVDLPLPSLGENSVLPYVAPHPVPGVRAVELHLSGSGAMTRLRWCPAGF